MITKEALGRGLRRAHAHAQAYKESAQFWKYLALAIHILQFLFSAVVVVVGVYTGNSTFISFGGSLVVLSLVLLISNPLRNHAEALKGYLVLCKVVRGYQRQLSSRNPDPAKVQALRAVLNSVPKHYDRYPRRGRV